MYRSHRWGVYPPHAAKISCCWVIWSTRGSPLGPGAAAFGGVTPLRVSRRPAACVRGPTPPRPRSLAAARLVDQATDIFRGLLRAGTCVPVRSMRACDVPVCVSVCLCVPVCLSVCLPACLPARPPACLPACLLSISDGSITGFSVWGIVFVSKNLF